MAGTRQIGLGLGILAMPGAMRTTEDKDGTGAPSQPDFFENVDCPHDVGTKYFAGIGRLGLCGCVKNNFRLEIGESVGESVAVTYICKNRSDTAIEHGGIEKIGPSGWRQAVTTDSRA